MHRRTSGKIASATVIISTNLSRISFVLIGYMRLKYPNLKRPDDWMWELSRNRIITYFGQPVNVWVSVPSILVVCRFSMFPVYQRVSQQPLPCQIIWQQLYWHHWLKKTVNNVIMNIFFTCLTANVSLSIVHMSICWTYIVRMWNCTPVVRPQLSTTALACDRCPSHMPVTELNMSTYQFSYNGADSENAENG